MNQPEAEVIAAAISIIRPKWYQSSLTTLLAKVHHRPARQVALALVYLAYDPDVESPGLLLKDGPWWSVATIAEPTYVPPTQLEADCRTHGQRQPCGGCRADQLAVPGDPIEPPEIEKQAGESLVQYARRIADLRNVAEGS